MQYIDAFFLDFNHSRVQQIMFIMCRFKGRSMYNILERRCRSTRMQISKPKTLNTKVVRDNEMKLLVEGILQRASGCDKFN
jgi:hypothetical protein